MYAKALAVGLRKRVEECTGQADFVNDCIHKEAELRLIDHIILPVGPLRRAAIFHDGSMYYALSKVF
jgi:hypothetical protein